MLSDLLIYIFNKLIDKYHKSRYPTLNGVLREAKNKFAEDLKMSIFVLSLEHCNINEFCNKAKQLVELNFKNEEKYLLEFNKQNEHKCGNENYINYKNNAYQCLIKLHDLWESYELNKFEWLIKKEKSKIKDFLLLILQNKFYNFISKNCQIYQTLDNEKTLDQYWREIIKNLTPETFEITENQMLKIVEESIKKIKKDQNKPSQYGTLNNIYQSFPDPLINVLNNFTFFNPTKEVSNLLIGLKTSLSQNNKSLNNKDQNKQVNEIGEDQNKQVNEIVEDQNKQVNEIGEQQVNEDYKLIRPN